MGTLVGSLGESGGNRGNLPVPTLSVQPESGGKGGCICLPGWVMRRKPRNEIGTQTAPEKASVYVPLDDLSLSAHLGPLLPEEARTPEQINLCRHSGRNHDQSNHRDGEARKALWERDAVRRRIREDSILPVVARLFRS